MSKVRDLPEQTLPEDTDLLYTVDDSEGVNGGRKIKLSTLKEFTSGGLDEHLDGGPSKHDASEIDYEKDDLEKTDISSSSDNLESAVTDLDSNKLSKNGNNSMAADLNMGGNDILNVGLVDGRDISADGAIIDSIAVLPTDVFVSDLSDFPTPISGVITLEDNKNYIVGGSVDLGNNRIVFGNNCSISGKNPELDVLIYTGIGTMFTVLNENFILRNIGINCLNGTMVDATNIDYTIDPSIDEFQGRSKRFSLSFCNLKGGSPGTGSRIGYCEGFATANFNGNLITSWDDGFYIANSLSFEALNNKSVLWNGQGNSMVTLRSNNWSNQTGGVGSYIPIGFNAVNFVGNVLHPRTADYAVNIEKTHSSKEGNITGNIFISTGITSGGIFNPASSTYNDLPEYNIQGNQGVADNIPTIQASIDTFTNTDTTFSATNTDEKLNLNNTVNTNENLLFSTRILVSTVVGFSEGEILTGATSNYTAKIQSIDVANNYIYVEYVIDSLGDSQYFTVGEILVGNSANTTYNGVDGSFKYFGNKTITIRSIATLTLEKTLSGNNVLYRITPYLNGVPDIKFASYVAVDSGQPSQAVVQDIQNIEKDSVLELYIANLTNTQSIKIQALVWNLSGR
jgi:hypothetical protein